MVRSSLACLSFQRGFGKLSAYHQAPIPACHVVKEKRQRLSRCCREMGRGEAAGALNAMGDAAKKSEIIQPPEQGKEVSGLSGVCFLPFQRYLSRV